jgi:hypothetical protein
MSKVLITDEIEIDNLEKISNRSMWGFKDLSLSCFKEGSAKNRL